MNDRFRQLIQNLDVGVLVQGPSLEIRVSNRAARDLLGLSEDQLAGRTSYDPRWRIVREDGSLYGATDRPAATVLATGRPLRGVVMGIDRPHLADRVWLLVTVEPEFDAEGRVVEVVSTLSDLTERKRLEASLLRAQKLESIGRLAGGVAHDFNNMLTVVLSNVAIVASSLPSGSSSRQDLDEAAAAGERAALLTRQLLTFASQQATAPRDVNIGQALRAVEKLLRRLIGERVELQILAPEDSWWARVDPAQLEQVIVNLAVNARDAMPGGGRLTITASNESFADATGRPDAPPPGDYACIRVIDEGHGMDEAMRARIFEPFFTTKPGGQGTGLGLAIVHGVIAKHGGTVRVDTEPGRGTTFAVLLPRVGAALTAPAPAKDLAMPTGSERVLLVEDEPAVRRVAVRILRRQGYTVLEATNGEEALEVARAADAPLDLVVTDLVMPRVDGTTLIAALRAERPDLRVLYVSGYAADRTVDAPFLAKPYTAPDLARRVRAVLDDPSGRG